MKNEIVLLKNVVEEKDKAITKLKTKHSEEVKELKKQQIQTTENLRSTVMEREVLRENGRILFFFLIYRALALPQGFLFIFKAMITTQQLRGPYGSVKQHH